MERRSAGVLEYWSIGVLEYWSIGVLEYWSVGVLECWSVGLFESSRALAPRGSGLLIGGPFLRWVTLFCRHHKDLTDESFMLDNPIE